MQNYYRQLPAINTGPLALRHWGSTTHVNDVIQAWKGIGQHETLACKYANRFISTTLSSDLCLRTKTTKAFIIVAFRGNFGWEACLPMDLAVKLERIMERHERQNSLLIFWRDFSISWSRFVVLMCLSNAADL